MYHLLLKIIVCLIIHSTVMYWFLCGLGLEFDLNFKINWEMFCIIFLFAAYVIEKSLIFPLKCFRLPPKNNLNLKHK